MTDLSHAAESLAWFDKVLGRERKDTPYLGPVEVRPVPRELTDEGRISWLGEYCDKLEYIQQTRDKGGHFVIVDCDGERTVERNFRDAVDMAAEKFRRANGED